MAGSMAVRSSDLSTRDREGRAMPARYGPAALETSGVTRDTQAPIGHTDGSAWRDGGTTCTRGPGGAVPRERGVVMTSAEPLPPASPRGREVRASVLAAFQLVEDARYLGAGRRGRRGRRRAIAERTVAYRRLARDLRVG